VLAGADLFRVSDPNRLQINASVLPPMRGGSVGDTAVIELLGGETRLRGPFDHPEPRSRKQERRLCFTPQGAAV
jgi:hypothetical protein